jgi:hypothetical protein
LDRQKAHDRLNFIFRIRSLSARKSDVILAISHLLLSTRLFTTIREEHAPQNNLLERVVAEGIAARGESHMAGELLMHARQLTMLQNIAVRFLQR